MKRTLILTAAALFIAGTIAPSFAHVTKRKHMHKKPVASQVESKNESNMTVAKDEPKTPPAATETKPAAPAPAAAEAKPAAPASNTPSMTDTMTDKAKDAVKDKVMDTAKDKAMDAATGGMKAPSVPSVPASGMKTPSVPPIK